jgi:hypothetical protein
VCGGDSRSVRACRDFRLRPPSMEKSRCPLRGVTGHEATQALFSGPIFTVLSGNSFGSVTGLVENNPTCLPLYPHNGFRVGR